MALKQSSLAQKEIIININIKLISIKLRKATAAGEPTITAFLSITDEICVKYFSGFYSPILV